MTLYLHPEVCAFGLGPAFEAIGTYAYGAGCQNARRKLRKQPVCQHEGYAFTNFKLDHGSRFAKLRVSFRTYSEPQSPSLREGVQYGHFRTTALDPLCHADAHPF
jgi:hypothetical protein